MLDIIFSLKSLNAVFHFVIKLPDIAKSMAIYEQKYFSFSETSVT